MIVLPSTALQTCKSRPVKELVRRGSVAAWPLSLLEFVLNYRSIYYASTVETLHNGGAGLTSDSVKSPRAVTALKGIGFATTCKSSIQTDSGAVLAETRRGERETCLSALVALVALSYSAQLPHYPTAHDVVDCGLCGKEADERQP